MRVATYNIRNVRALDRDSCWWRRRRRLAGVVQALGADLIGMQEVYRSQIRWLRTHGLPDPEWGITGVGRNRRGGGEAVPLWHRSAVLRPVSDRTRWFGPTPDVPGSRIAGAQFPRIATVAEYETVARGERLAVVNLHLDSASAVNRAHSIAQIAEWLDLAASPLPVVVMGDFNGPMQEEGFVALTDAGLRSALPEDAGPTSNGFGRGLASQQQIDHVFVSREVRVDHAEIVTGAGFASDHYPVVVDLEIENRVPSAEGP